MQGKAPALQEVFGAAHRQCHDISTLDGCSKCGLAPQPSERFPEAAKADDAAHGTQATAAEDSGGTLSSEPNSRLCCCLSNVALTLDTLLVDNAVEKGSPPASVATV